MQKLQEKYSSFPDIDFEEVKLKEKIAKMKEARIKSLITKIGHVMSSMESNLC
jgi:hypothetical protein